MDRLPRGITGFRNAKELPLPTCDLRAYRGVCHAVARALGGKVSSEEGLGRGVVANFACVVIDMPGRRVGVAINLHHPIVAFVEPPSDTDFYLRFAEAPELADLFRATGEYAVFTPSEVGQPVTAESCRELGEAELKQVAYWRPRCIGDVVFNRWD